MRTKNLVHITVAIITVLTFCIIPVTASASVDVYNCAITLIGYNNVDGGTVSLKLDDLSDDSVAAWVGERAFYLHDSIKNFGYATLLTAISLGKTVRVRIAGTATPGSLITHLWINQ